MISSLIAYCSEVNEYTIEDLKSVCQRLLVEADFVTYSLFLWSFYQRENCVGPSVYTEYVEETRAPLIKGGPLPVTPFDPISNKNE